MDNTKYSIIILCYKSNEKIIERIKQIEKSLKNENINYEIILVCNYFLSEEQSFYIKLKNYFNNNKRFLFVNLQKEGMYGWDVKSGLDQASGDFVSFIDGDGQFNMSDVISIYKIIIKKKLDFVKTFRIQRKDGKTRYYQSKSYNFLFKILFPKYKTLDINSKPKIFSRKVLNKIHLKSNGWFIDTEIFIKINYYNFKYTEIPTIFEKLENRKSLVNYKAIIELFLLLIYYRIVFLFK